MKITIEIKRLAGISISIATEHERIMSLLDFGARAGALPSEPKTRTPARAAAEASRAAWVSAVWEGALVIGLFLLVGGVGLYLRVRLALPL